MAFIAQWTKNRTIKQNQKMMLTKRSFTRASQSSSIENYNNKRKGKKSHLTLSILIWNVPIVAKTASIEKERGKMKETLCLEFTRKPSLERWSTTSPFLIQFSLAIRGRYIWTANLEFAEKSPFLTDILSFWTIFYNVKKQIRRQKVLELRWPSVLIISWVLM